MNNILHRVFHIFLVPKFRLLALNLTSKILIFFSVFIFLNANAQEPDPIAGKKLFNANCAACHKLNKKAVGPALKGVSSKYEKEWLYKWIKNSSAFIKSGDERAIAIWEEYNRSAMNSFTQLSNADIDNIIAYTDYVPPAPKIDPEAIPTRSIDSNSIISNEIILGALSVVFLLLVIMLILVRRTLLRIAKASGVEILPKSKPKKIPIWRAFVQNQFLVFTSVIMLLLSSAYYVYGFLMQVGIDQGYMPLQPIHYSHKIHAGANQIECKYCHSSARVSKHSGIPSLNVCMNCHKNIAEYNGEEDIVNGYTKEFYTNEIKKLYKAVGWDEENQVYNGNTEPVKWVRIHNLPDFVYFNHAQHVMVGEVDCQKCHGPVEEMEIMYQYSPLTMGWCINCHRETNIKVKDNEYYTKIHDELSKKYGVEKLTVAQMGGLECGKCHY
ncbi:MAG: cytochrome C [Flavobacteriaceae bacterium]|nr:cytochrome C [Flavobacteriaceae bacterium]|tara:strand:- start:14396 stop:15715 length:1320 start_codon:yes stop_codon:yes gene_type:complete